MSRIGKKKFLSSFFIQYFYVARMFYLDIDLLIIMDPSGSLDQNLRCTVYVGVFYVLFFVIVSCVGLIFIRV